MNSKLLLSLILALQVVSAFFFVGRILVSLLGLPVAPINWTYYELIEIGAALALVAGVFFGAKALTDSLKRTERAEESLRIARSAFCDLLQERFEQWDLTAAERDVTMFAIKGFSTQDIASMRGVSEGTVKAQTNSIYRKAGVSGRPQLLSLFIDELIDAEEEDQSSQA